MSGVGVMGRGVVSEDVSLVVMVVIVGVVHNVV